MSPSTRSTSIVSLSFCAVDSCASHAAALSGSTHRSTNAGSRLSHAGVLAQSCRCSQPIAAFSGAKSLARAINCSAAGAAAGAAKLFVKLRAAAVATEFASERAASARTASSRQRWYLSAGDADLAPGAVVANAATGCDIARHSVKNFNPCLTIVKAFPRLLQIVALAGSRQPCGDRQTHGILDRNVERLDPVPRQINGVAAECITHREIYRHPVLAPVRQQNGRHILAGHEANGMHVRESGQHHPLQIALLAAAGGQQAQDVAKSAVKRFHEWDAA